MNAHTPITEGATSETAPTGGLEEISTRMTDVVMASHDAGNLRRIVGDP